MSLTDHVTSLALSQRLKEAGFPQGSVFCWRYDDYSAGTVGASISANEPAFLCAAPLATELLEWLWEQTQQVQMIADDEGLVAWYVYSDGYEARAPRPQDALALVVIEVLGGKE